MDKLNEMLGAAEGCGYAYVPTYDKEDKKYNILYKDSVWSYTEVGSGVITYLDRKALIEDIHTLELDITPIKTHLTDAILSNLAVKYIKAVDLYGEEYVMSTLKAWEDFYTGIVDLTKHVLNRSKIKVVKDEEV